MPSILLRRRTQSRGWADWEPAYTAKVPVREPQQVRVAVTQGFPGGAAVKNLPANPGDTEKWVRSLGQGDPLEEEMATHSSILAWKFSWTEEPGGIQSMGVVKSRTQLNTL